MTALEPADHQALQDRQTILNVKKFEFDMLTLAYNVVKAQILTKYGLDPNGNYTIDPRGLINAAPLAPDAVSDHPDAPSAP